MPDLTTLGTTWVGLIGLTWVLYLVLGGADLGVGMLLRRLAPGERSAAVREIGPTWAANDVWLIVAVAVMFGAFPGWYAAWASGLYLPLVVLLVAIIVRHAGIELLGHHDGAAQARWSQAIAASSALIAFGWGVVWVGALDGSLARGDAAGLGIVTPHGALAGLALVALCRAQGAAFLAARADRALQVAARRSLRRTAPVAALLTVGAAAWVASDAAAGTTLGGVGWIALVVAGLGLLALLGGALGGRGLVALGGGALAVGAAFGAVLAALAPLGIAGPGGIALGAEASGDYTLGLMLAVAVVVLPLLLAAQLFGYLRFLRGGRDGARGGLVARTARTALEALR